MTPPRRKIAAIASILLKWFSKNARDLPWRRTGNPYAIWVAEIMLQQTQVKTVIPFWERWMAALPTIDSLACASSAKIHKLWEGLGYYTRVRNLQAAARLICKQHRGKFPETLEQVLELPGIGRYTAGAICSIAFDQPVPILDGNVIRVLTRAFGIHGNVRQKETLATLWGLAESLVKSADRDRTRWCSTRFPCSHLNQSLMELGALVCTPKAPRCPSCPIQNQCVARKRREVERLPVNDAPKAVTRRRFAAFVAERDGRLLVRQRPNGVVNGYLWEFPNAEITPAVADLNALAREATGMPAGALKPLFSLKHSITRYRIQLDVFRVDLNESAMNGSASGAWLTRRQLKTRAFSSAHRKILDRVQEGVGVKG